MFIRETFIFVNEKEAYKRENLYESKGCRWIKYTVIPAMMGFILVLILMNVDLSVETKKELSTVQTTGTTITTTALMPVPTEHRTRSYNLLLNNVEKVETDKICRETGTDMCTIFCSNGNLRNLAFELERSECIDADNFNVIINNCTFPWQKLMPSTFTGYFNLKSLEIFNSDLEEIDDGSFDIKSMRTLLVLHISTTDMKRLTDRSFKGLTAIQEFKFSNVPSRSKFIGIKFLQPMAETLQQVSICQKNNTIIYDPISWFNGNEKFWNVTRVDLSGNNFANTLTEKTFSNLPAVREFILADCAITKLNVKTFVVMIETLEYLDLSSNALQMLNVSTLISKNGLRLELHGNAWSCSCENYELIKALQASQFTYEEEPLCATPLELKNMPLKEVTLKCEEEVSSTHEPQSSITTSPVKTSSSSLKTSPSSTKTTAPSTIPVETPNTSFETSPSSSTSSESEETEEMEEGKATNTTTVASITITSSPPKLSTLTPVNPIELDCNHFNDAATPTNYTISIRNSDVRFTVRPTSSSSVVLLVSNNMEHFRMIFFTANNRTFVDTTEKSGTRSIMDYHCERKSNKWTMIHVHSLDSNETYIFCLIHVEEHTMSPFNCQSHHMNAETSRELKAWLLTSDKIWFYILIIFGIVLDICLGLIAVYWLLHWRPTWLRGCKRIIKADDKSREVYLLAKPTRKSAEQDESNYENRRLRTSMSLDTGSTCYMQFHKDLQDANRSRKIQTLSSILSPKKQAPAVPQNRTRTVSLQSTIPADDLIEQFEEIDDNDYQSIDYYEQLF